jgi:hypothetical protein
MSSELNDVIHRTMKVAFDTGVLNERVRVAEILVLVAKEFHGNDRVERFVAKTMKLIKEGENNA